MQEGVINLSDIKFVLVLNYESVYLKWTTIFVYFFLLLILILVTRMYIEVLFYLFFTLVVLLA